MALMPYHVLVTRQILLDGPMTLFATLTLYLVARYANDRRQAFLYAAATAMALAALSKETGLVLLGGVYAFFALAPEIKVRTRYAVTALSLLGLALATFPISLTLAGKAHTGGNYLAWQLFRRPNHDWTFYPSTVPHAIGYPVVLAALAGIWILWRERSWRETLLLSWVVVPIAFFQTWPVKGFQYLLPIAPAVAVLAARTLTRWPTIVPTASARARNSAHRLAALVVALVALSLLVTTIGRLDPPADGKLLAGSGGLPGGRETGRWIRSHVPEGATIVTIGPSMANVVQFYGHRKAYGLSVSPNPLNRNPSYEPVVNPDRLIRDNEVQYLVWDSFSASRSKFFSRSLKRYADRYNGRAAYMYATDVKTAEGQRAKKPLIVVYEVRP
jgi:4-amino-4-deoxy-L-arabinose transferase-like glycosyltransferase